MPQERIDALRRQRALVADHLAWLDAELAAARGQPPDAVSTALPPPTPAPVAPTAAADKPVVPTAETPAPAQGAEDDKLAAANARADAILEEYSANNRFNPEATRRGCILAAVAALLFGVAGLMVIYLVRYR